MLMMPDHTRPFQIQVDSSLFATGGILTQMDINGDHHPCAYLSKSLTKEQRNYDTGDRELLAIVHALKNGGIIFKDQDTQPLSYLITITSDISKYLKQLDNEWQDGHYIFLNLISN